MIGLGLIISKSSDTYVYRVTRPDDIAPEIVLFALISMSNDERTLSFDVLQELSLIFCMPVVSLIEIIRRIEKKYPGTVVFSDNSGIKNLHFIGSLDRFEVLDNYYDSLRVTFRQSI